MSINPSIALQAQTQAPPMVDPLEAYGKVMSLKNMMAQAQVSQQTAQMNQMKLDALKQEMADDIKTREILSKYNGDAEKARPELLATLGDRAIPVLENMRKYDESVAKLDGQQAENARKSVTFLRENLGEIFKLPEEQRNRAYQEKMGMLLSMGVVPKEMAQKLPFTWDNDLFSWSDDSLARTQKELEIKAKEADLKYKASDEERKQAEEQRKGELHPLEIQGKEADIKNKQRGDAMSQERFNQELRLKEAAKRADTGTDTAEDIANYAEAVSNGELEITNVPAKLRGAVVKTVHESGNVIVSAKERESIQALDIPLGIIKDIEKYADKINTESGMAARTGGAVRSLKAKMGWDADVTALKSKVGTLALLIRALGEKGTLAEGDVSRAIALIPSVYDTKQEKDNKLSDLRGILTSAKQVKTKGASQSYGQPGNGPKVGDTKTFPNGKVGKWDGKGWVAQ